MNGILGINLGVLDIEDAYGLYKSAEGNTHYLRLRVGRTGFVTELEDSYKYAVMIECSSKGDGSLAKHRLAPRSGFLEK